MSDEERPRGLHWRPSIVKNVVLKDKFLLYDGGNNTRFRAEVQRLDGVRVSVYFYHFNLTPEIELKFPVSNDRYDIDDVELILKELLVLYPYWLADVNRFIKNMEDVVDHNIQSHLKRGRIA